MELIATARFKITFDRAVQADAYTRKITDLANDLSGSATNVKHPLLEKRETIKNSLLLVICSNRGLCGGYNASILREANGAICAIREQGSTLHLELSGKRAIAYFRYQGVSAETTFTHLEDKPRLKKSKRLLTAISLLTLLAAIDQVQVCYMKFVNAAKQMPVVAQCCA